MAATSARPLTKIEDWVEDRRGPISRLYWVIAWVSLLLALRWPIMALAANGFSLSAFVLHPTNAGHWSNEPQASRA
jgi:hypothetical protein